MSLNLVPTPAAGRSLEGHIYTHTQAAGRGEWKKSCVANGIENRANEREGKRKDDDETREGLKIDITVLPHTHLIQPVVIAAAGAAKTSSDSSSSRTSSWLENRVTEGHTDCLHVKLNERSNCTKNCVMPLRCGMRFWGVFVPRNGKAKVMNGRCFSSSASSRAGVSKRKKKEVERKDEKKKKK